MAKKIKTKAPALTCGECIHEYACAMWNTGTITRASAEHCTEYTTCRESAAYLVGRLEERKEQMLKGKIDKYEFKRTGTCWDCKHYDREEGDCLIIKRWFGEDILGGHDSIDFCSKIERRENDENN